MQPTASSRRTSSLGRQRAGAGARCSTATQKVPCAASHDSYGSSSRGGRVQMVVFKISDPKAWRLLLYPTNKKSVCVHVCVCVGVLWGWMGGVCHNLNKQGGKEEQDPCTTMNINTEQECTKYLTFFSDLSLYHALHCNRLACCLGRGSWEGRKTGSEKHHTAAGALGVGRPFFLHVLLKSPVTHTAKML